MKFKVIFLVYLKLDESNVATKLECLVTRCQKITKLPTKYLVTRSRIYIMS